MSKCVNCIHWAKSSSAPKLGLCAIHVAIKAGGEFCPQHQLGKEHQSQEAV